MRADIIRGYWALADWPEERRRVPEEVTTRVRLQEEPAQERRRQQDLRLASEQPQRALSQARAEELPPTAYDPDDLQVQLEKVQDLLRPSEARAAQLQVKLDDVERALAGLNHDTESDSPAHGRPNRSGRNPDRSRSGPSTTRRGPHLISS